MVRYADLKRFLSIFSDFIFDSSVDPGTPNLAAALDGPDPRPSHSINAASMIAFSSEEGSFFERLSSMLGPVAVDRRKSQLSSTEKFSVSQTITGRSITFCNSRMLPGHGYD